MRATLDELAVLDPEPVTLAGAEALAEALTRRWLVGAKSLDDSPILVERLVGIGYDYVPDFERVTPLRRCFRKMREGRRTHHIHLVERS
jgi:hypothetical protein